MDEWKYEPARDLGLPTGERLRSLKRESGLTESLARLGWRALIRFYLLHVMILPLVLVSLLGVHMWRVRKDGGIVRPADADRRLPPPGRDTFPVFTAAPQKTYHLAAIVRGK